MTEDQFALVPESLRTEANQPLFDSSETLEDFMKGSIDARAQVSTLGEELENAKKGLEGKISIPGEDADEAAMATYRKAIGVPEDVSGYGIEGYEKIDGGSEILTSMLDAGLTPAQAKKQLGAFQEINKTLLAQQVKAGEEKVKAYKESLGEKAEGTFNLAKHGIDNFFKEEEREAMAQVVMSNPALIGAYAKIGSIIKERPGVLSIGGGGNKSKNIYKTMEGMDD